MKDNRDIKRILFIDPGLTAIMSLGIFSIFAFNALSMLVNVKGSSPDHPILFRARVHSFASGKTIHKSFPKLAQFLANSRTNFRFVSRVSLTLKSLFLDTGNSTSIKDFLSFRHRLHDSILLRRHVFKYRSALLSVKKAFPGNVIYKFLYLQKRADALR